MQTVLHSFTVACNLNNNGDWFAYKMNTNIASSAVARKLHNLILNTLEKHEVEKHEPGIHTMFTRNLENTHP
jgi:hypothetical protein